MTLSMSVATAAFLARMESKRLLPRAVVASTREAGSAVWDDTMGRANPSTQCSAAAFSVASSWREAEPAARRIACCIIDGYLAIPT